MKLLIPKRSDKYLPLQWLTSYKVIYTGFSTFNILDINIKRVCKIYFTNDRSKRIL